MLTTTSDRSTRRLLAGALLFAFALAACGGAAAPTQTPGAATTPRPTPTLVPGDPGSSGGTGIDPGGGGSGSDGNAGGGIAFPPGDPNENPLLGDATYLKPAQGLVNQRTVNVQLVRAVVNENGTASADLRWWSGVAPCTQLDRVEIAQDESAHTIHLKVIEGSGKGDVACIEIAQLTATAVDLGVLASGTWTISVEGGAPAIKLDVP
jgi:hypothetical protein